MKPTTVRLLPRHKARLEEAAKALERRAGRRLTRGEAVEALARAALQRPELLDVAAGALDLDLRDDPLFDPSFVIDMGATDAKTLDKILYGTR